MPKGSKTVGLQQTQEKEVEIFLSGEEFYSQEKEVLITAKQDGKENSVHSEERSDQLGTMDTNEKQLFPQKDEAETSQQSRWLEFMQEEDGKVSASRCAELLRSMDLMQSESEPDEDEGEKSVMPKELIEQWTAKRNLWNELNECAEEKEDKQQKKPKLEKKWGPIIPCRKSSRNAGDGRTEWWTARQSGAPGERAINDDISSETVVSQMSYSGVVVNADRQCDANYAVTMDGLSAV
ncbi:hypothetical protein EJB05_50731, partial [Eragrostis curvula]